MPRIPLPETNQLPQGMLQVRAADTTAVGRAMMGFGESIAGLGAAFGAMAKKQEQEKEQQDLVAVRKTLVDERLNQMQTMEKMQTDAPLGAPNFTKDYLGNFEKRRAEIEKQNAELSPKAREALNLGMSELRNGLADNAMRFESQSAGKKAVMDAQDTQQKLGQIAGMNPTEEGYNTAIQEWDKTVDALPNIDAATRETIRRNGRDQISLAAAQAWVDANPEEARKALSPPKQAAPIGDREAYAMDTFMKAGYTREQAAGIVGNLIHESGGLNTKARNPGDGRDGSDSIGVAQWNGSRAKALKDFAAAQGKDWHDYDVQLQFVLHELNGSESAAGRALRNAKTADDAAGVIVTMYERPAGSQSGAAASHGWSNRRDQARRLAGASVGRTVTDGQTGVPQLDAIPQDKRNALLNRAEGQINQQAVENRAALAPLVENATAAYMATGEYAGPPITEQMFQQAYPQDWETRWAQFQNTVQTGETIAEFKTLPLGEIQSRVEALQPATDDPLYADKYKAYEVAQAAAKQVLEARQRDPAAYVMQAFPKISDAVEAASAPDAGADAIRAQFAQMDAAYDQIGMPANQRFLLTDSQVSAAMDRFNNTELTPQDRVAAVQQALASTSDPDQRQRIFEQFVAKDKDFGRLQSAFNAWERGDEGAARRLFTAGMTNPDKVMKAPEGYTDDMIGAEVEQAMLGDNTIGDAKYGLRAGILENTEMFARDKALAISAVKQAMIGGKSIDEAVELTMRDIHGPVKLIDVYVSYPEGTVNLYANAPEGTDIAAFRTGAVQALPVFRQALEANMPPPVSAKDNEQSFLEYQRLKRRVDDIMDTGQLRNLGDGYGFYDPVTQGFVAGSDGQPIVLSLERILNGERRR